MSGGVTVRSTRVALPDGVRPAAIHIDDGVIVHVDDGPESKRATTDFGDLVILPGLVDTHVHVNEPGRADWEGFDTATRAAAAGGVTTIVDMPLNSIPATTTVAALERKRACARGQAHVDVAFWGGIVPGNTGHIGPLIDAGVRGFKCFLVPSGVDEFPPVDERDLADVLPILSRRDVPLLVHAEDPAKINRPADKTYASYLASRPSDAEASAVTKIVRLAREFDVRVHIVHVACAEAADIIRRAREAGVRITAETCPHYLSFAADEIPEGATEFKCAPPIRNGRHRLALWQALRANVLDFVATDHSPSPDWMKCRGDFASAWGGIASLELSLRAMWTAAGKSCHDASDDDAVLGSLARWMSDAPARLAGLPQKGRIAAGCDGDLAIFDPEAEGTVDPALMEQRHKLTPYAGRRLRGLVTVTIRRGECVWQGGTLLRACGGRLL
jgi:allantoinase